MNLANKIGGLVIGTGDMSELALAGRPTTAIICRCTVSTARFRRCWCAIWCAIMQIPVARKELSDILLDVLDTPVNPELLPPEEDGKIAQKTEDLVGPYELHDFYLYYILRFGYRPGKIYRLARQAFDGAYDKKRSLNG